MKLLFVGQVISYASRGSVHTHCVEGRDLGLTNALSRLGHDVHLVTAGVPGPLEGGGRLVTWKQAAECSYDGAVICSIEGHWKMRGHWGGRLAPGSSGNLGSNPDRDLVYERVRKLGNVVGNFDSTYPGSEELGYVKAAGMLSPPLVPRQKALHPTQHVFNMPLGCPNIHPSPDPFPVCERDFRVIYCGRIPSRRMLDELNLLAEANLGEVWLIATFQLAGPSSSGMTDEQRANWLSPKIRLCSDLLGPVRSDAPHGPVRYLDTHRFLYHADVGVNWAIKSTPYDIVNSKITEYLGAGCAVVTEVGPPNVGDVLTAGAGCVVEFGNRDGFHRAVQQMGRASRDRDRARMVAQALWSWDLSARLLESHLTH